MTMNRNSWRNLFEQQELREITFFEVRYGV
jgi:hypothetical protein